MKDAIYSSEYKFLYFKIPKCGTRTCLNLLGNLTQIKDLDINKRIENFNGFLKFTFVRNPYDRLVSFYFNKLYKIRDTKYNRMIRNKLNNNKNYNFKEFILKLAEGKNIELDKHWNLYANMVDFNHIDFVGRFENFQEDFDTVCDKIGIPHQQLPHLNKSKHKHYTEYYDDETRAIVAEKYAKDIEHFGYKYGE